MLSLFFFLLLYLFKNHFRRVANVNHIYIYIYLYLLFFFQICGVLLFLIVQRVSEHITRHQQRQTMSSSLSSSTVSLYRYDLTQGMARSMGPMLIGRPLEGIWHTSIVVFGKEYYFDGGVGIMADANPGRTRFGTPYRTEVLGQTTKRQEEFFAWTQRQRTSGFGPNDYHLLNNNCNSFSDAASMFLLNRHIPQDILDMIPSLLSTPMGQMLRPMLEQATSAGGPGGGVGAGGGAAGMAAAPLTPRRMPGGTTSLSPSAPSAAPAVGGATRTDTCVGLLSPRQTVTESDEEDLMLAQAMLESNETIADGPRSPPEAFDKAISGLTLLQTVMSNICEHPAEAKYRALSVESNAYKTKLKPLEPYGVTEVLRIAGFVRRPHSSGSGGEQWFLSDSAGNAALLQRVLEMLTVTISSIEGAAADAAKARAEAGGTAAPPSGCSGDAATKDMEGQKSTEKASLQPPASHENNTSSNASPSNMNDKAGSAFLRYCYPPFPKDWTPLVVGRDSGEPLFSIHCLFNNSSSRCTVEGPYCFGKCYLSSDQQHLQAYYCSSDGREVAISGGYEVLCVQRGQEGRVTWVPARLACGSAAASPSFVFYGYGKFGVARAEQGCSVTPGVMEPSGRCVVPYCGRAVVVTDTAEVLCEAARIPPTLAQTLHELDTGARLSELLREASGQPIGSFDSLLSAWQPPAFYVKPQLLQVHTRLPASALDWESGSAWKSGGAEASAATTSAASGGRSSTSSSHNTSSTSPSASRLLVCHELCGSYTAAERHLYVLEESDDQRADRKTRTEANAPNKRIAAVEGAYTVGYWDRVDYFVYFSHKRISVPPREWINDGHRHGVPVLGTIITEGAGGASDLQLLLSDAKRMAAIIERLVQLCDVYGFDGYLLNVENDLPANLAKRVVVFCTQLRKQLNRTAASHGSAARLVIWYDAMTVNGTLTYQNALTPSNKPFFDVCDGLFTNYFWNPVHVAISRTAAGTRGADVFVGVDVFGRRMYGGGGYTTNIAVEEAVRAGLSVALFAPGWTMESESKGSHDGFEQAERRMWSRLQDKFAYHTRLLSCGSSLPESSRDCFPLCVWTSFQSGVGYDFYVNGRRLTKSSSHGPKSGTSAWCALSSAHKLPPFAYEAPPTNSSSFGNPVQAPAALTDTEGGGASTSGPFAAVPFRLPAFSLQGSMYGGMVHAAWRYDRAWFGDRCLSCALPPKEAAEVLRWNVRNALPAMTAAASTAENTDAAVAPVVASPSLNIEVVVLGRARATAALPSGRDDGTANTAAPPPRGPRPGLSPPSRAALPAPVWEQTALTSAMPVPVGGLEGVQVRVTVSDCSDGDDSAVARTEESPLDDTPLSSSCAAAVATERWCRVHYELQNTSSESVHLTSVAVANGDATRTLRLCVGAIALYQTASSPAPEKEEGVKTEPSVLEAAGPHIWSAHVTHPTRRAAEQVLSLSGADDVFANVRARHGAQSSIVLFASVTSTSVAGAAAAAACTDGHHMYLGQYSVDPADGATYDGALLVPLLLPTDSVVSQVYFYVVQNGY